MQRIKNITRHVLSKAWASLHRIEFDYQFKDGRVKRIGRECYNRGDGVSILLYNKKKSSVILTKQFRMPIYENYPNDSFSIEACAGAIDSDESPKATIIREVEEEVGYKIPDAQLVFESYTSPGALTEKMYLFIAEYDTSMKINEGGGVASEDEEIEVIEMSFKEAMTMLEKGEIKDAKTIMLLQYAVIKNII